MIFSKKGTTSIVTQEKATIQEFIKRLEKEYDKIKNDNIIINLFSLKKLTIIDVNEFLLLSKNHIASGQSFIIVTDKIGYDEIDNDLQIVPTLQEAHDMVEMEEIERDLGF